jgi:hypothetical protein
MIQGIYPVLSALRAFGQKLGVTANNILPIWIQRGLRRVNLYSKRLLHTASM